MSLDFREDYKTIYAFIESRVAKYDPSSNVGPGEPDKPIRQIDFGYQFDQGGWIALVFDTRPDAEPDGEWGSYIEENALQMNHWVEAMDSLFEDEKPVTVNISDGTSRVIRPDIETEDLAAYFGIMLRDALIEARGAGVFASLPLAQGCVMSVEEHDGEYGWPVYEKRDEGLIIRPAS